MTEPLTTRSTCWSGSPTRSAPGAVERDHGIAWAEGKPTDVRSC